MAHKQPWLPEDSAEYERDGDDALTYDFDTYRTQSRYPNITQGYVRGEWGGVKKCERGEPTGKNWEFVRKW